MVVVVVVVVVVVLVSTTHSGFSSQYMMGLLSLVSMLSISVLCKLSCSSIFVTRACRSELPEQRPTATATFCMMSSTLSSLASMLLINLVLSLQSSNSVLTLDFSNVHSAGSAAAGDAAAGAAAAATQTKLPSPAASVQLKPVQQPASAVQVSPSPVQVEPSCLFRLSR